MFRHLTFLHWQWCTNHFELSDICLDVEPRQTSCCRSYGSWRGPIDLVRQAFPYLEDLNSWKQRHFLPAKTSPDLPGSFIIFLKSSSLWFSHYFLGNGHNILCCQTYRQHKLAKKVYKYISWSIFSCTKCIWLFPSISVFNNLSFFSCLQPFSVRPVYEFSHQIQRPLLSKRLTRSDFLYSFHSNYTFHDQWCRVTHIQGSVHCEPRESGEFPPGLDLSWPHFSRSTVSQQHRFL